ncbi:hypothetical protein AYO44_08985 [Planctomycetaceae bacterium SCGC AG-212-F19]|nr:hypothetical protein AYO44_08985 [Planctomycetaceae bacterium SCGC AG-212-F19]
MLFGVAYTQAPLYYSNQNQYFLHGLAQGGRGFLADDWLANTPDPTPVFSFVVALTCRFLNETFFYVYYLGILGIYAGSLLGLFDLLYPGRPISVRLTFAVGLVLLHSGLLRLLSGRLFDVDYPWYFQAGVAGQYLLGPVLQPSTFGVLLLLSVALFVADRPSAAAISAALAAVGHSTYLPSAGILVFAYLCVLIYERRGDEAFRAGALAALLVAPVITYNVAYFAPTSAATFAEAQTILVHFRIPHHCLVSRWLDGIAAAQIAWVLLGIYLVRGSRLFPIMLICALAAVVLSVVQVATGNGGLALLFPWRPSVFLVPIATAIILGRVVVALAGPLERLEGRAPAAVAGLLLATLVGLAASGLLINWWGLGYQMSSDESGVMAYVEGHKAKGDLYLLPVDLPLSPARPGASMSDFKALGQRKRGRGLIPIELQGFRLKTGAPIFVDFKAIPYRDVDVLEWHRRLQANLRVYESAAGDALPELRAAYPVTHVLVPAAHPLRLSGASVPYEDQYYRLYRLAP